MYLDDYSRARQSVMSAYIAQEGISPDKIEIAEKIASNTVPMDNFYNGIMVGLIGFASAGATRRILKESEKYNK